MPNRLAQETSPYLLQHKDNPVAWLPWGDEALALAAERDVPILLSVGYSSCHWCHVMERESFEDPGTAAYMNEHFVPVKVDREERPDVDALYMEAVQSMTGQGGWPMTVFLDPDGVPFYGGTYFPPEQRRGMPSFLMVMEAVSEAWRERREEIRTAAGRTRERLGAIGRIEPRDDDLAPEPLERAVESLRSQGDLQHGGFGSAPKFPPASALDLLLGRGERALCERTLDAMAGGGIYDQLGGGFSRYSVDAVWLVPHFEKMLYDNALLARTYLRGWLTIGHDRYRRVCRETLDWALTEMRGPEGGFYSALDADSEGVEGRYYVWSAAEMREVLAAAGFDEERGGTVPDYLGVSEAGNWEGSNVLNLREGVAGRAPDGWPQARAALLAARGRRIRPGLDDKRLAGWNALMIGALADAGAALAEPRYLDAAGACADFILGEMTDGEGRLLRSYKDGEARIGAFLEDHAFLLEALLALYEADFEPRWFEAAERIAGEMVDRFGDRERGGFFTTAAQGEQLIARRKDLDDHPIPSGNASAALGLLRLEALSGERRWGEWGEGVLRLFSGPAAEHPQGLAYLLRALDFHLSPARELALIADESDDEGLGRMLAVVRGRWRPSLVVAAGPPGATTPALLADRVDLDGRAAAYLCERFACRAPVGSAPELESLLGA